MFTYLGKLPEKHNEIEYAILGVEPKDIKRMSSLGESHIRVKPKTGNVIRAVWAFRLGMLYMFYMLYRHAVVYESPVGFVITYVLIAYMVKLYMEKVRPMYLTYKLFKSLKQWRYTE